MCPVLFTIDRSTVCYFGSLLKPRILEFYLSQLPSERPIMFQAGKVSAVILPSLLLLVVPQVQAAGPRYSGTTWQIQDTSKKDSLLTATRDLTVPASCWQDRPWDYDNVPYIRERLILDWKAREAPAEQEWFFSKHMSHGILPWSPRYFRNC